MEYFINAKPENIILDQLQSEQGARFMRKRNRNIIIKIEEDVPVFEDFRWMTLGQIKELMRYDNMVNMDTRTVLSGLKISDYITPLDGTKDMSPFGRDMVLSANTNHSYINTRDHLSWLTKNMSKRVGIICPSDIAFRRFLPSLQKVKDFSFAGVAIATSEEWANDGMVPENIKAILENERSKANNFVNNYGGKVYEGYQTLITSSDVDVIYLPLPPALHFKWAKLALESGKHIYVEKPFTTAHDDTLNLLKMAAEKHLAVHENYMFIYHQQLQAISNIIAQGEIGKVRQYRITFGFPRRAMNDFRYNKSLGGGALLDVGGYCMKYAACLLGDTARIVCAHSYNEPEFEVDILGSCTMVNDEGTLVQMSFGMDCDYKCELEAWGSKGTLTTGRILTAPAGFEPEMTIKHNQDFVLKKLPADDAFEKSIRHFLSCMTNDSIREHNYEIIKRQSSFVEDFKRLSNNGQVVNYVFLEGGFC